MNRSNEQRTNDYMIENETYTHDIINGIFKYIKFLHNGIHCMDEDEKKTYNELCKNTHVLLYKWSKFYNRKLKD